MARWEDRDALDEALANLLINEKYSDLIIECGDGRQFKVHKAIVCSRSSVLAAQCDNNMVEKRTGIIKHSEFNSDTVARMISYMYTNCYELEDASGAQLKTPAKQKSAAKSRKSPRAAEPEETAVAEVEHDDSDEAMVDGNWNSEDEEWDDEYFDEDEITLPQLHRQKGWLKDGNERLKAHTRVYAIADYYDLPSLKSLARGKFCETARRHWSIKGFAEVAQEVYTLTNSTDVNLRRTLLHVATKHAGELVQDQTCLKSLAETDGLQEFMAQFLESVVMKHVVVEDDGDQL